MDETRTMKVGAVAEAAGLTVRTLGLGLDSIAVCLDAGVDPARLVRDHLVAGLAGVPAVQATAWRALARYLDLARRSTHPKEQEHA